MVFNGEGVADGLKPGDPAQLGAYRLLGRLGRGGMGTVYFGEDPAGRKVAVKVINPEYAEDETFRARFEREVAAARRVSRFCTAPVIDADLSGDQLYVVTEYVAGPDLHTAIRSWGPMQGSNLESLGVGVAAALTAIHGAGLVHRDLKPANVLLSPVGPRVIDFGIARALDGQDGTTTRTGQLVGTPSYTAPELINGEAVTPASDVFSWGCLVTFAGTGRAPFEAPTIPGVLYAIAHKEPELTGLDPGMRALVERALAKDPAARPSAQELLDRLVGHGASADAVDRTVTATWPPEAARHAASPDAPTAQRTRVGSTAPAPPRRRRRWPYVLTALALVVAATGVAGYVYLQDQRERQRAAQEKEQQRRDAEAQRPPKAARVWSDDFRDVGTWSDDTYDPIEGVSGYGENGYVLYGYADEDSELIPMPEDNLTMPPSAMVSVTATAGADSPDFGYYGLFCRGGGYWDDSADSRYEMEMRGDGRSRIYRIDEGAEPQQLTEAPPSAAYRDGEANRLHAACVPENGGVRLTMWVNNTRVASAFDPNPLEGDTAGFYTGVAGTGESTIKVLFDDFALDNVLSS